MHLFTKYTIKLKKNIASVKMKKEKKSLLHYEKFSSIMEVLYDIHAHEYLDQNIIGCGPSL